MVEKYSGKLTAEQRRVYEEWLRDWSGHFEQVSMIGATYRNALRRGWEAGYQAARDERVPDYTICGSQGGI
jgi:hypothetical protein